MVRGDPGDRAALLGPAGPVGTRRLATLPALSTASDRSGENKRMSLADGASLDLAISMGALLK